jgi:hypothetical protein
MINSMKLQSRRRFSLYFFSLLLLSTLFTATASVAEPGGPQPAEPLQKEKFFDPERFSFTDSPDSVKSAVQPHLSVSHDAREDDVRLGVKQTSERVHGEAGGKLNLLGDISLTTFAKIPVYTKETVGNQKTSDGVSNSELFKNTGRFSWRSELGIPVKKGVDLNFFYDNSTIGKIDKPGVEEREEKFGTRFIFKFE